MIITKGATDVSVYYYIRQDASATSPGEPVTGLLFSNIETGGSASYARQGAARVDLTLITLASASAAHSDGGFILVDDTNMPGLYRCDYPDAAFATGVNVVTLQIVVASANNAVADPIFVQLTGTDLQDTDGTTLTEAGGTGDHLTAINLPNQTMDITGSITGSLSGSVGSVTGAVGSVTAQVTADMTAISGDSTAAGNLENAFDDTAGAVPWTGISDQGTAQSATATTLVLRAAAAFADDTIIGSVAWAFGSTQGYWQARIITDHDLGTDTVTVDTWTVTPSGTITYKIFAAPPSSTTAPIAVNVKQISDDATAADNLELACDNYSATRGLTGTALPAAAAGAAAGIPTDATGSTALVNDISTNILPESNVAFNDLEFLWVAASDHVTPVTGASTTSVTRSIDGGAFGSGTGALAEVGNGIYQYDASAADMNGTIITFRFVATGGTPGAPDDAFVTLKTSG